MKERTRSFVLMLMVTGIRGRGGGRWRKGKKKKKKKGRGVEQAHLYVWLPSAKRSDTPGLINSEKRSQSFFPPHTSTHGLAVTFTSFEAKSGSRYSTLQWSDTLRCCHPACHPQAEKRKEEKSRALVVCSETTSNFLSSSFLYLMTLSARCLVLKCWEVTAALFDLPCSNPYLKSSSSANKLESYAIQMWHNAEFCIQTERVINKRHQFMKIF